MTGRGDATKALADLACLSWKMAQAMARDAEHLPEDRAQAAQALLRFSTRKLGEILAREDMRIVTYENDQWSAQIPANPVNLGEIAGPDVVVDSTIEPTIARGTEIIVPGRITLRND